jgi:hypothetical protein
MGKTRFGNRLPVTGPEAGTLHVKRLSCGNYGQLPITYTTVYKRKQYRNGMKGMLP